MDEILSKLIPLVLALVGAGMAFGNKAWANGVMTEHRRFRAKSRGPLSAVSEVRWLKFYRILGIFLGGLFLVTVLLSTFGFIELKK